MEKKKREQKIACSTNQETETNDLLSNAEQNTPNVALDGKNDKTDSRSHEKANSMNLQYPPVHQWPYTPQQVESPSLIVPNRCQQLSHLQPNPVRNQVQQGHPPLHLAQSTVPFWLPPRTGYQVSGVNMPATFQTFTPLGTINGSWQAPAMTGVNSSSNQPQVPNLCYPVGYPYTGFPGPNWDSSSWCVQGQQPQLPCTYTSPGGYGYVSPMSPPMPSCLPSAGQSFQRGIIRPMAKLSQKHQQLWEAQSAENVQLWTIIGQLQSELADYKSRLNKLEAEISSQKPAVEEPVVQVNGTPLTGQPAKRGRPRKSAVLVDVLPTPNESCLQARGRKPAATCKVQSSEARTLTFEKVILNRVEDKEKACHSLAITQPPENDEKISNIITKNCGNLEVIGNDMMKSTLNNQVHQENPRIQILDNADDSKTTFSIISEQDKSTNGEGSLVTHTGTTANGSFQNWSSDITPESCGRNVFNMISQGFYENGSVIRQGEKHIAGWSFVHEDNASEQIEDAVVGSVEDDNDKEMVDDATSGGEDEIAPEKVECAYPWMVR
ncbi:hypothetical protein KPL70_019911 [Citrus sinensis]|uniref:uncharacterized protein LOC102609603 n=1 Tax=Citrus sinensis TaxID=2711 RepID=UPI000CED028F|nr:uncharacterized protein LOC102609603 [Citrus sinensis]XP_024035802.1 uncharacterized protein LOC18037884 isoform X1 [Citrus x clementina]XP_052299944.1 uncharacterized protein LOC102609603 [Citrus sinensis]XP_052299945.1 uncharacterized protein LOC102609603 [Citrus sinensis]KAH9664112.1 hypothetical protein KPL70_019911 [Citrus sinensis]